MKVGSGIFVGALILDLRVVRGLRRRALLHRWDKTAVKEVFALGALVLWALPIFLAIALAITFVRTHDRQP